MERNIKDYAKEVAAHVKEYLPEELSDCTVKVLEVRKGQTMVSEILVRKEGVSFSPLLPVSQFFNDNVNEEDAAMRIVDMVGKMYREDHSLYSSHDIEDYNICSQKLFIRVYGRKEKLPVPWPHKEIAFGLDAVCYIDTSENSDEGKTINVTSDMMDNWGKSFEEVFAAAAAKPSPISTPFTAPMDMTALARSASSLSKTGSPSPAGMPFTRHSMIPPEESPSDMQDSR